MNRFNNSSQGDPHITHGEFPIKLFPIIVTRFCRHGAPEGRGAALQPDAPLQRGKVDRHSPGLLPLRHLGRNVEASHLVFRDVYAGLQGLY